MDVCPTPEELRRFQDEELGDGARQIIAAHVNRCASCQEWLDQHPAGSAAELGAILAVPYLPSGGNGHGLGPGLGWEEPHENGVGATASWPPGDGSGAVTVPKTIGKYLVL